jgi:hypothetical protein
MTDFTPTQGRYLSFIHTYTSRHGCPPAESEIAAAMCVSPPSVNQMVKTLEKKGLILRQPGVPRSIRLLVPEDEIPLLRSSGQSKRPNSSRKERTPVPVSPPTNLYVLAVCLMGGPVSEKFANKEISRVIEIRGDARTTTLDDLKLKLHRAFGYWFDFGDDWFHQVQVERIDQAIPTVTYPRVIRRVGKSPPQYSDAE